MKPDFPVRAGMGGLVGMSPVRGVGCVPRFACGGVGRERRKVKSGKRCPEVLEGWKVKSARWGGGLWVSQVGPVVLSRKSANFLHSILAGGVFLQNLSRNSFSNLSVAA